MRFAVIWVVALGSGLAAPLRAQAQPQDDAALAEVPVEVEVEKPAAQVQLELRRELELQPPLTTEQLRVAYPDLELATTPHVTVGIFLGSNAPFQLVGFGLRSDAYVVPRFRLSGFTSVGIAPVLNREGTLNLYVEASLALVVARWQSQTTITIPVRVARPPGKVSTEPPPMRRGIVPSSHSLELEAGMLSGHYALYRCTDACAEPDVRERSMVGAGSQLAVPFAGLRYVYFRLARSRQTPFRAKQRFQFAADILTRPVNNPEAGLQNVRGKTIKQSPVGARFAFHFPGIQKNPDGLAFSMDIMAGYFPSPSDLILHTSIVLF